MMTMDSQPQGNLEMLLSRLDQALAAMSKSPAFSRVGKLPRVLDSAKRVIMQPGGCSELEKRASFLDNAGVFDGSDWAQPQILVPAMSSLALQSNDSVSLMIEALSELRLVAVAKGEYLHPLISAEQAHHYLTQVLAINLDRLFMPPSEADRVRQGRLVEIPRQLFGYIAERIGYECILDQTIDEVWRILQQRPIQVDTIKKMITQIAICLSDPNVQVGVGGAGAQGFDRLISSLYSPTLACREDPGLDIYRDRLGSMDTQALQSEAAGCARSMHDTGLVSDYHVILVRHLLKSEEFYLLADALGLSTTGRDCMLCYRQLVQELIDLALHPATAQAVYGLALMLERGILYQPSVAPAMWRQVALRLSPQTASLIEMALGDQVVPETHLLAGVLCMLGLPMGIGQGNNPTCQSARALSMWAYNDPDYLLQVIAWAARDNEVIIHFEGQPISSRDLSPGIALGIPVDLDAVSLIVVPHLDRIYAEMGRLCIGREGDPHRWINPEFHGWWVGRGFAINVDVLTGKLRDIDEFLRYFYATYHPYYNGNQPLIHPQPAGIAITDSAARFIGWHAISIMRVALDPSATMRVYFYNPNNDSGQDWGDDVVVSTSGNGERYGEASLTFEQFVSRLYIFHFDPLECGALANVSPEELARVKGYIERSWGADRMEPPFEVS